MSVSEHVFEIEPRVAVIVAVVLESTPFVGTANVTEVAPVATVTVAGGTTLALFELRLTTAPPAGAGATSVTVPFG